MVNIRILVGKNRKVFLIICLLLFLCIIYLLNANLPKYKVGYLIDNLYEEKCRDKLYEFARKNPKIALDVILEKIDAMKDPKDKLLLVQLIGWLINEKSEQKLLNYLNDKSWQIRFFAVEGLSYYDSKEVNDKLFGILEHEPYWQVRRQIVIILTNRKNKQVEGYLTKELNSDDMKSEILANLCLYILKEDSKYFNFVKELLFKTDSDDDTFKKKLFCIWTIGDLRSQLYLDLLKEVRPQTTDPKLLKNINSALEKITAGGIRGNKGVRSERDASLRAKTNLT